MTTAEPAAESAARTCFSCGQVPVDAPRILCDTCRDRLDETGEQYWARHRVVSGRGGTARVESIDATA